MKHSLISECPCEKCERARFEHRVVMIMLVGLLAVGGIALLVGRL